MSRNHTIPTFPIITDVHDALLKTPDIREKNGVLLMGISGEGKSTLFNHLLGTNYVIRKRGGISKAVPQGKEWSKSSDRTCSETSHPVAVELEGSELTLIDMPGIGDTRGNVEQTIVEAHIRAAFNNIGSISSLILVSSWKDMTQRRMNGFRTVAEQIGSWINNVGMLPKNLSLVITKAPETLSAAIVHDCLKQLASDEAIDINKQVCRINPKRTEPILWKKHCLTLTIKALLKSKQNVYISDLEDPSNRIKMLAMINNHAIHGLEKQSSNKSQISERMNKLRTQILTRCGEYLIELKKSEESLKQINKGIADVKAEIKSLESNINKKTASLKLELKINKEQISTTKTRLDNRLSKRKGILDKLLVETERREKALLECQRLEYQDRNIDKSSYDIFAWGIIDNSNELRYTRAKRNHDNYLEAQSIQSETNESIKQLKERLKEYDGEIQKNELNLHHAEKELDKLERKLRMTEEIENQRNERLKKGLTLKRTTLTQHEEEKRNTVNQLYKLKSYIPYLDKCLFIAEHLGLKDDANKTLAMLSKVLKRNSNKAEKKLTLFSLGMRKIQNGGSKKRFEIKSD